MTRLYCKAVNNATHIFVSRNYFDQVILTRLFCKAVHDASHIFVSTVQFEVDSTYNAFVSGGPLTEEYRLAQFHLHWGRVDRGGAWWEFWNWGLVNIGSGSEHTLDEKQ
jgi:hypothetical protein